MGVDFTHISQENAELTLIGFVSSLGINVAMAIVVLMVFTILRPNNSLVYAPKFKYSSDKKKPPQIPSGLFSWLKVIMKTPDDVLLEKIGYDAVLFIVFIRMLRKLMYIMTAFGVFLLIPLNVIANRFTSTWPPKLNFDLLSFSSINAVEEKANINWYWIHFFGTWLFSFIIYYHLLKYYRQYIHFRQLYFQSPEYQRSTHARTLIIFNLPSSLRSDESLRSWVDSMKLKFPVDQVCIGRRNNQLAKYVEEHEAAVRKLEITLSNCLQKDGITVGKRPTLRQGGFLCFGGNKVDAIDYYTKKVQTLREKIIEMRSNILENKTTNYGWISFREVQWAHSTAKYLSSPVSPLLLLPQRLVNGAQPRVELAPQPKDIIWENLSLNEHIRRSKRILFTVFYYALVIFWFIPYTFLSTSSNVKDFIRLFPNSGNFLKEHKTFVALLSSWFTPIVMAIIFLILPKIMRLISQHQGYFTTTSLDRQVFAKLYTFFIVNNLLFFTIASTLIKMYSQIKAAAEGGQTLTAEKFFNTMSSNLSQIAKNLNDVSNYWLSYVTLKGLGCFMELAQVFVLVVYVFRKIFRPSPRQLQEFARPSRFEYAIFYNLLIFFFTVGLTYAVIAPIVLPFTMVYFMLATMVFKYLLMYVFVTGVETGGQMWRILFNRLIVSILLFQVVMIGVLRIKSANIASMLCIPLPICTGLFKLYCLRRLDPLAYYYKSTFESNLNNNNNATRPFEPTIQNSNDNINKFDDIDVDKKNNLGFRFGDPAFFSELPIPMVHDNVRHLLPTLYGTQSQTQEKTFTSKLTRKKTVRHLSMIQLQGHEIPFQSVKEDELENDDSTEGMQGFYKFDEEELEDVYPNDSKTNIQSINNNNANDNNNRMMMGNEHVPLTSLPQTQLSPKRKSLLGSLLRGSSLTGNHLHNKNINNNNDPYSATRPLMDNSSMMTSQPYDDSYSSHYTIVDQYHDNTYNNNNHHYNNYNYNSHSNFINNNNNNNNNNGYHNNNVQPHPDVIEMSPFFPSQVNERHFKKNLEQ